MSPEFKAALKRRAVELSAILAFCAVSAVVIYWAVRPLDASACIGRPESEIIARLGTPSGRFQGDYQTRMVEAIPAYPRVETLFWKRLTGTLYLSTSDDTGVRICFRATWVPNTERTRSHNY